MLDSLTTPINHFSIHNKRVDTEKYRINTPKEITILPNRFVYVEVFIKKKQIRIINKPGIIVPNSK